MISGCEVKREAGVELPDCRPLSLNSNLKKASKANFRQNRESRIHNSFQLQPFNSILSSFSQIFLLLHSEPQFIQTKSLSLISKLSWENFGGKFLVGTFLWEKFGWSPTLLWVFPSSSPSHSFSSSSSLSFLPPLRICYNCNGQLNGNMKIELARILNEFSI